MSAWECAGKPDRGESPLNDRAPLREPPITADPLVLQEPVIRLLPEPEAEEVTRPEPQMNDDSSRLFEPLIPLPPDLPPPVLLDQIPGLVEVDEDAVTLPDLPSLPPPPPELPALPITPLTPTDES